MKNNLKKEQVIYFLKKQWKPLGLGSLILFFLLVTLLIPARGSKSSNQNPAGGGQSNPSTGSKSSKKSSNPFAFLFGFGKDEESKTQKTQNSTVNLPPNNPSQIGESTVIKVQPNGTKTTQKVSGNTVVNTTQGTLNTNSNIAAGTQNNQSQDNLSIVFQNPDGSTTEYIPPGTPPNEVRWGRYTNDRYNYAINYPVNWELFYFVDQDGHEGIALYPPYVNSNDVNAPRIGFGLAKRFYLPVAGETANALITPIKADGINGNLYTDGVLGTSYIASVFQYNENYFGLGSSMSDATFAYVYYYMLHSLTFNIE